MSRIMGLRGDGNWLVCPWLSLGVAFCLGPAGPSLQAALVIPTVTLQASNSAPLSGQAVMLTAVISPSTATGTVTFFDGAQVAGIRPLAGGQAIFSTSMLAFGRHSLTAFYGGDSADAARRSAAVPVNVSALSARGFQTKTSSKIPSIPNLAVQGDFNGDGIADLAVINGNSLAPFTLSFSQVSVLLGNGDGTFQAANTYLPIVQGGGGATNTNSVAVGDFNGDGLDDMAINLPNGLDVYLSNGDGTFRGPTFFAVSGEVVYLVAGDFNGDGRVDIAWSGGTGPPSTANAFGILLGNGDGSFQASQNYAGLFGGPLSVVDLNGDGHADLVGGLYATIGVALGNGDGTFQAVAEYTVNGNAVGVAVGDFNGDGVPDIVAGLSGTAVSVLLGSGDGTFQALPIQTLPGSLNLLASIAAGDFDGDGRLDLAVSMGGNPVANIEDLYLMSGRGDGTFNAPVHTACGIANSLVAGDFNRDGRTDLITLGPAVKTLLGFPAGSVPYISSLSSGAFGTYIVPGAWTTILGSGFTDVTDTWNQTIVNGQLPIALDGIDVNMGGKPAYVEYVSACQINVQAPDIAPGTASVTVGNTFGVSDPAAVTFQAVGPAFFEWTGQNVVATHTDYSLIAPAGLFPDEASAPAKPGDIVILWGSGFGPANPPVSAGTAVPSGQIYNAANPVTVYLGSNTVPVIGAALAPGYVSLYQVAIQIPASTADGTYQITASVGGVVSRTGPVLAVQH